MISNFRDWKLNEAEEVFRKSSFREVSTLIRKQFPDVKLKTSTAPKAYYSPREKDMRVFKLGEYFSSYLYLPCKKLEIQDDKSGKTSNDIAKFLQKNKIVAWTNDENESSSWSIPTVYIFGEESVKAVKKMEKAAAKEAAEDEARKAKRDNDQKESREAKEKYEKLYDMLKHVPYGMKFTIPNVGDLALLTLNGNQTMWSTWGGFRAHDANSLKDVEELTKIVNYIYNESSLKTKLAGKKYGL